MQHKSAAAAGGPGAGQGRASRPRGRGGGSWVCAPGLHPRVPLAPHSARGLSSRRPVPSHAGDFKSRSVNVVLVSNKAELCAAGSLMKKNLGCDTVQGSSSDS